MNVAVIGSGISGLSAAYLLSPHMPVTLYEKDSRLGGHAHTHDIRFGTQTVAVDSGFMVFNPSRYPHFVQLLATLGINTVPTSMTFSVSAPGVEYASDVPFGIFAKPFSILDPRHWWFLLSILRFNAAAKQSLAQPPTTESLGEFLTRNGYSGRIATHYLLPMIGSIWSCSLADMQESPARDVFEFLDGHQLLNAWSRPAWRTIPGGSRRYVDALRAAAEKNGVRCVVDANVRVTRGPLGIVVSDDGVDRRFDHVIIATHADEALALLADASPQEQEILGAFTYARNDIVLHSDPRVLPRSRFARASWNYVATGGDYISLTYDMNKLQHIPSNTPVFVTLNPQRAIDPGLVHAQFTYDHPCFSAAARTARSRLPEIQGVRNTLFAGAHWGYGFHEDGIASAVAAVKALGITPPWTL